MKYTIHTLAAALLLVICETPLRSAQAGLTGYDCNGTRVTVAQWPSGRYRVDIHDDSKGDSVRYEVWKRQHPNDNIRVNFKPNEIEVLLNGRRCKENSFED